MPDVTPTPDIPHDAAATTPREAAVQAFRRYWVYLHNIDGPNEANLRIFTERVDAELAAMPTPTPSADLEEVAKWLGCAEYEDREDEVTARRFAATLRAHSCGDPLADELARINERFIPKLEAKCDALRAENERLRHRLRLIELPPGEGWQSTLATRERLSGLLREFGGDPVDEVLDAVACEIERVEATAERLRAALEEVEFVDSVYDGQTYSFCLWCGADGYRRESHKPDCQRQLALTPPEPEEPEA